MKKEQKQHIVIIGGGFGGMNAALELSKKDVQITLIDKRNFHLFQPLLYQVASGGLSPADIAYPLRSLFTRRSNVRVIMDEVNDIDLEHKTVLCTENNINYDYLVIAAGAQNYYFGKDEWQQVATGLKTIEDATEIRSKILSAFEQAEKEDDPEIKSSLLTFAIVGGGPAGVEMAGAIAEISRHTLRHDFRTINPSQAKIILIEGADRILPVYPESLSKKAERKLQSLGVDVICNNMVNNISDNTLEVADGDEKRMIKAQTIIWAAGVRSADLAALLIDKYDLPGDKGGRIKVQNDCTIPGQSDVYVIGDMAHFATADGGMLPGVAPVAIQQGRHAARMIWRRINGKKVNPFRYIDKGNLAVIGRKSAVGFKKDTKITGILAWLIWLFVHLLYLVGFEKRLLVAIQWAINYFTFNRSARLIANYPIKN
jgi:NADH dehydrogenase